MWHYYLGNVIVHRKMSESVQLPSHPLVLIDVTTG